MPDFVISVKEDGQIAKKADLSAQFAEAIATANQNQKRRTSTLRLEVSSRAVPRRSVPRVYKPAVRSLECDGADAGLADELAPAEFVSQQRQSSIMRQTLARANATRQTSARIKTGSGDAVGALRPRAPPAMLKKRTPRPSARPSSFGSTGSSLTWRPSSRASEVVASSRTLVANAVSDAVTQKGNAAADVNATAKIATQSDVRKALKTPPGRRTLQECETLLKLVRSIRFFDRYPRDKVLAVTQILNLERFHSNNVTIFREGEPGTSFYLVLVGELKVLIGNVKDKRGGKDTVGVLKPGDTFGEVALLEDKPRNATIISTGPVELVRIERSDFHCHVAAGDQEEHSKSKLDSQRDLISKAPAFRDVDSETQAHVAKRIFFQQFSTGETLWKQGDSVNVSEYQIAIHRL
jgi:hypothetical protein